MDTEKLEAGGCRNGELTICKKSVTIKRGLKESQSPANAAGNGYISKKAIKYTYNAGIADIKQF